MATSLNPPLGGRGVLTVADDQVDHYIAQGWTRAKGQGASLPDPEPTTVLTDTGGGPEADDSDVEYVDTLVSRDLGDEEVLGTVFGTKVEPVDLGGNPKADDDTETRPAPVVADVSGDEPVKPATRRKSK